jgi:hypothetical protein
MRVICRLYTLLTCQGVRVGMGRGWWLARHVWWVNAASAGFGDQSVGTQVRTTGWKAGGQCLPVRWSAPHDSSVTASADWLRFRMQIC